MIIYRVVANFNKNGVRIEAHPLEAEKISGNYETDDGIIYEDNLLSVTERWPETITYCKESGLSAAQKILSVTLMDMYRRKKKELSEIEEALGFRSSKIRTSKKVSEFIETNSTALYRDDEPTYFFLPYWYEKQKDGYKAHSLDNLPDELKSKMLEWQEFAENNPELKLGL